MPIDTPAPRRAFLKNGLKAGAAAGVLAGTVSAASAHAAGKQESIKVGVIGCGGRGSGAVGDAINAARDAGTAPVQLVAAGDLFADTFESKKWAALGNQFPEAKVSKEAQYAGFDAYQKVLEHDLDYVILATPPGFRPDHFAAAVEKGIDVFCEKPVATDAPGVRKFLKAVEAAKAKNLKVGIGLQRHHQNSYLEALEQIKEGAIGDVVAMKVYWNGGGVWDPRVTREEAGSEMEYQLRNWYYYSWVCGDHIAEQHIHNLDVGNWWAGAKDGEMKYPVLCRGMGGREVRTAAKYGNIFDHFACQFEYADGKQMISECRHIPNTWSSVSEIAHGTEGVLTTQGRTRIYHPESTGDGKFKEKTTWAYRGRGDRSPYVQEHIDLQQALRDDAEYNEGERGAMSTMTALLGRMATYSGKELTMAEALNSEETLFPYDQELSFGTAPPVTPGKDGRYQVPTPGVTNVLA